jgi:hypothetical protein
MSALRIMMPKDVLAMVCCANVLPPQGGEGCQLGVELPK